MRSERTTGLSAEQFADLARLVLAATGPWDRLVGRPRALGLGKALKAVLMYFKNNLTQEVIAELLEVSQPTISRTVSHLAEVVLRVLEEFVPDPDEATAGRVVVLDGSLCPCWSWSGHPELYSGKHHTTGHNHQFLSDLGGVLRFISDPQPGRTHDARAIRTISALDVLDLANGIADKGYIGTSLITPFRKPLFGELTEWQKEFNKTINQLRYVIERAIANFKTWRIMHTDYRRPLHTYPTAFGAVRALHFFKQSFE